MREFLHYEIARDRLLALVRPVETECVPLAACGGRVLAADVCAAEDVPSFDRSAFDGYAFRSADAVAASETNPVTLRIVEEIRAGDTPSCSVTAGTAAKILTGAPLPPGADAVCKYEDTEFSEDRVTLFSPAKPGSNVVRAGEDVRRGALLMRCGTVIDAGGAGVLAAQGIAAPAVYRRPRIGLLSTGSELVEAEETPPAGKIRNANRHVLTAALQRAGMEPHYLGTVGDDAAEIRRLIALGLETCDAVISTGGVSVGDYDLTPAAMEAAGVTLCFRGVDLKPGMACAYGVADGKLCCGLSGNPAAALTNFYAVALPALRRLAGWAQPLPPAVTVCLTDGYPRRSPATRMLRGTLSLVSGTVQMALSPAQGNAVLHTAIGCDVMAIIPAGSGPIPPNTPLKGFLL